MAMAVMNSTTTTSLPSSINSSLYLPPSTTTTTHLRFLFTSHKTQIKEVKFLRRKTIITHISSQNPPLEEVQKEEEQTNSSSLSSPSASDIVRNFYNGINKRDLASVEDLIAEKCVYEDLIFPQPFIGRQEILEFFKKFTGSISKDLQFVIDDISDEDSLAIGVTWHLGTGKKLKKKNPERKPGLRQHGAIHVAASKRTDWQGRPFPFSKGCSFYRLELINGKKQIIYARDSVEPAIKPGETALVAIRGVTWLLQRFPGIADKF